MRIEVRKNEERRRYEAVADGEVVGIADYVEANGVVAIPHTEVQPRLRGQGVAADLVRAVLDDIRAQGSLVDPQCSYVDDFMRRDPLYADLSTCLVSPTGVASTMVSAPGAGPTG